MVVAQTGLPLMKDIKRLADEVGYYPINGLGVSEWAEHLGYPDDVIDFVKLFSAEMVFNSKTDLVNHCSLLERVLKEERIAPIEYLRSPQG